MRGDRTDGHRYIPNALAAGAAALIIEEQAALVDELQLPSPSDPEPANVAVFMVPAGLVALQELARLLQLAPRHVILAEEELCFLDHAQIQVGLSSAATSGPPLPCVRRKVQLRALMKPQGQQTEGARGRAGALLLFWRCLRP